MNSNECQNLDFINFVTNYINMNNIASQLPFIPNQYSQYNQYNQYNQFNQLPQFDNNFFNYLNNMNYMINPQNPFNNNYQPHNSFCSFPNNNSTPFTSYTNNINNMNLHENKNNNPKIDLNDKEVLLTMDQLEKFLMQNRDLKTILRDYKLSCSKIEKVQQFEVCRREEKLLGRIRKRSFLTEEYLTNGLKNDSRKSSNSALGKNN